MVNFRKLIYFRTNRVFPSVQRIFTSVCNNERKTYYNNIIIQHVALELNLNILLFCALIILGNDNKTINIKRNSVALCMDKFVLPIINMISISNLFSRVYKLQKGCTYSTYTQLSHNRLKQLMLLLLYHHHHRSFISLLQLLWLKEFRD